jgi:two-component system, LytTR family, response regulator
MIRAIVADDEPPARRRLRRLLAAHKDIAIEAEAATGDEAVAMLRRHGADVLFLDINMPGLDGFGVLEALGGAGSTRVVFVTAYEEHARRAFDVDALDYLLKPVSEERLATAVERLRRKLAGPVPAESAYWTRILVQGARVARFVQPSAIDWIESDRNYVVLHCGPDEHLIRATLDAFAARLDPRDFARINRSTVVNLNRVRELRPWTHGEYQVVLESGRELIWSRRYNPPTSVSS